jgi:hypothetical protein
MLSADAHQFVVTARIDALKELARENIRPQVSGELKHETVVRLDDSDRVVLFSTGSDDSAGWVGHFRFEQRGQSWWAYDVFIKPTYSRYSISRSIVEFFRNGIQPEFPRDVIAQESFQKGDR